jgi:hypothetical protein
MQENNTPISEIADGNLTPASIEQEINHPKNNNIKKYTITAGLMVLITFLLLGFYFYYPSDKVNAPVDDNPTPVTSNPSNIVTTRLDGSPSQCEIKDYKNLTQLNPTGEINLKDSNEIQNIVNKISDDDKSILADVENADNIKYLDENNSMVAYILATTSDNKYSEAVYLYSQVSKEKNKVFELKDLPVTDTDLPEYNIKSVGFRDDNKYLYITTRNEVYEYSIESSKLQKIINTDMKELGEDLGSGIYGYYFEGVSPDNKYLVIGEGYWEGRTSILYDLEKRDWVEGVELSRYTGGSNILGWYQGKLLVYTSNSYNAQKVDSGYLYFLDIESPTIEDKILTIDSEYGIDGFIENDDFYFLDDERNYTGICVPNNVGDYLEVETSYEILSKINLKTKNVEEILRVDATNWAGVEDPNFHISNFKITPINGEDTLVVLISKDNDDKNPQIFAVTNEGLKSIIY